MNQSLSKTVPVCLFLYALLTVSAPGPARCNTFMPVSEQGFDATDNRRDFNDYPWSMVHYDPLDDGRGYIYVGTGNSMMNLIMDRLGINVSVSPLKRPPEIRRFPVDQDTASWERIFDYRDIETEDQWETSGIRALATYTAASDGTPYIYAGTLGTRPALWRSATGDNGTWEKVLSVPVEGSIRALAEHNGLLYIAVTHEFLDPPPPGELYVTDGQTVSLVNDDGFGNEKNSGVFSLASFNGWLYAGTSNREQGFEVWKLAGPGDDSAPVRVVSAGGPFKGNQAAATMQVFQHALYVGGIIFAGINTAGGFPIRGADMIRIYPDDSWATVVGPDSTGGTGSGFDKITNAYLWSAAVHDGYLYFGTWDSASFVPVTQKYLPDIRRTIWQFLFGTYAANGVPTLYDVLTGNGAELYRSKNGEDWEAVFKDGLGNPDNYGVRTLTTTETGLFIGLANIDQGLQVWRMD